MSPIVDVILNVCDYQQVGSQTIQLLRRIKRKKFIIGEDIQYVNVQYVPLFTNDIHLLHIKLLDENGDNANVYHKCQFVLHFKKV